MNVKKEDEPKNNHVTFILNFSIEKRASSSIIPKHQQDFEEKIEDYQIMMAHLVIHEQTIKVIELDKLKIGTINLLVNSLENDELNVLIFVGQPTLEVITLVIKQNDITVTIVKQHQLSISID